MTDGRQTVRFDARASVAFETGYASGLDARLTRARIRFAPARGGTIAITICAAG